MLGDITQLKTRFIYQCIESRVSWDKKFNINNYNKMVEEILFWKFNITKLNNKSLYGYEIPHLFIYSDASNTGPASVYKENGKLNMCKKNFNFIEETKSSTWRELEAIRYSLDSMKNLLRNKHVKWHTDNYASSIIAKSGSNKRELQELAIEIFNITFKHNIRFDISWIPRKGNELADKFSKTIDCDVKLSKK